MPAAPIYVQLAVRRGSDSETAMDAVEMDVFVPNATAAMTSSPASRAQRRLSGDNEPLITPAWEGPGDTSPTPSDSGDSVAELGGSRATGVRGGTATALSETRQATAGVAGTFINLMNAYTGSGLLGLPYAFQNSGLVAGLLVMAACGIMATHCMLLLVECKGAMRHRGVVSYEDIVMTILGPRAATAVGGFLVFTQYGFCVVYMVFLSDNIHTFFPQYTEAEARKATLAALVPWFVALSWVRTLSALAVTSLIACFAIFPGLLIVLAASFVQISEATIPEDVDTFVVGVRWETLPVMMGVSIYAFEGIGIVIPSETAMRRPEKFPMALIAALALSTILYSFFGAVPYVAFGNQTGYPTGQITSNVAEFAEAMGGRMWLQLQGLLRISFCIAIGLTLPTQLFVVSDIGEECLFRPGRLSPRWKAAKQNFFRTSLVVFAAFLAIVIPRFGPLVSLIGSFGGSALQFVFPPLCSLWMPMRTEQLGFAAKALRWGYVAVGVLAGVAGTVMSFRELVA